MKKRLYIKIISIMLIFVSFFSVATTTFFVEEAKADILVNTQINRTSFESNITIINNEINVMKEEKKKGFSLKEMAKSKEMEKAVGGAVELLIDIHSDPDNINWKNVTVDTIATAINLVAAGFRVGGIVSAITGPIASLLKDKSPSEIQLLKEHLDEQFEIVNQGIEDIRSDISDLSTEMNESMDNMVVALQDYIRDQGAGEKVYAFTSSGEGNFNYKLFKNYLFGVSDSSNTLAKYAYVDKIAKAEHFAIEDNTEVTDEEFEKLYNDLYRALNTVDGERTPYIEIMREYITGDEFGHSIQRYYYDWLSGQSNMAEFKSMDTTAEWEAIWFTLDLCLTLNAAEYYLATCNDYFRAKIGLQYGSNPPRNAYYSYESPEGYKTHIAYTDLVNEYESLHDEKKDIELSIQVAKDVAYILNMENSYTLEDVSGDLHIVNNNDKDAFGKVYPGQKIYMNKISDEICEMFNFDPQKFVYQSSLNEENAEVFEVPETDDAFSIKLFYEGCEIYTIDFTVNDNQAFSGGNGTKAEPYLITTPEQFALIKVGKESKGVYYKLTNDVDFSAVESFQIGNSSNAFEGVFDGAGHTIKNLTVSAEGISTGLFSIIALNGEVKNLVLDNAKIGGGQDSAKQVYCGGIAGKNLGKITNCHVKNSEISSSRSTWRYVKQRIETYVGGIAGISSGAESKISNCSVVATEISGDSFRSYDSGENKDNDNEVYVGGLTAILLENSFVGNCIVEGDVIINATAETRDDDDWDFWHNNAYAGAFAAGIAYENKGADDFSNVVNVYVSQNMSVQASANSANGNNENASSSERRSIKPIRKLTGVWTQEIIEYSMPEKESVVLSPIKDVYTTGFVYDGNDDAEYGYNEYQVYTYDEDFLQRKIQETVKDEEGNESIREKIILMLTAADNAGYTLASYEILGHYGLNTKEQLSRTDGEPHTVTVVFLALLKNEAGEAKTEVLSVDIPIIIEKIKPMQFIIDVLPKTQYAKLGETISLDSGKFSLIWEDGTKEEVMPIISGAQETQAYGKTTITLSYAGLKVDYEIEVNCAHNYTAQSFEPTCSTEGFTRKTCSVCGDTFVDADSVREKLEHTIEIRGAVTATCTAGGYGYTGDKYCSVCNELLENGTDINVIQHEYECLDGNSCRCRVCESSETTKPHEYESVENSECIVYACAKCGYSYTVDKKVSVKNIARVVVGNSYGIAGRRDEIAVYIKIFDNPGITGVSFRIEYDEKLEYVGQERGDVLSSSSLFEVAQAKGVLGIVNASADASAKDGNLVKLIFRLPSDAQPMDSYDISIASTKNQFTDKDANVINIVTMSGSITAVTHLPGDVNSDNVVDMLDTALVARYVAIINSNDTELLNSFIDSQNGKFDAFYADVNLNGDVELDDLVIMLQYFVGKNTQELASNEYKVALNANNGTSSLEYIVVKYYDELGNPGHYPALPTPTREGYRFDGWYSSFIVADLEKERIDEGDDAIYDSTYLKQTLYAHWTEIYYVEYDVNAPTVDCEVFGSMPTVELAYEEKKVHRNEFSIEGYTFLGWAETPDGEVKYTDKQETEKLANGGETIKLYAIWQPNSYTVQFRANAPAGASTSLNWYMQNMADIKYGTEVRLPVADYNFTGWKLVGWVNANDSSKIYDDAAIVKNLTSENNGIVVLNAIWRANEYEIVFDANNPSATTEVSGEMPTMVCVYDDKECFLTENAYVLPGWTFTGWATSPLGDVVYCDGNEINNLCAENGAKKTLYAKWEANVYTVKYLSDGVEVASSEHTYDVSKPLTKNTCTKEGYTFVGWKDSNGRTYIDGEDVLNVTTNGSISLYAQWLSISYTWDSGDRGIVVSEDFDVSQTQKETLPIELDFARLQEMGYQSVRIELQVSMKEINDGYQRLYMFYKDNPNNFYYQVYEHGGEGLYDEWGSHYITVDVSINSLTECDGTIVLAWGAYGYGDDDWRLGKTTLKIEALRSNDTYVIHYESNGGVGAMKADVATYNESHTLSLCTFTKDNAHFVGWNTKADGTGQSYADRASIVNSLQENNGNIILYAQWVADTYRISFVTNASSTVTPLVYSLETVDGMELPNLSGTYSTYPEYNKFLGWYEDREYVQPFNKDDLKANPRDIVLYAKWDICQVYHVINTPQAITGNRVIVDWSSVSDGAYDANRMISIQNVSEICFIGNPNTIYNSLILNVYVGGIASKSEVIMYFENFNFDGALCQDENSVNVNLDLICKGKNSIQASDGEIAIAGFASLLIEGEGELTVRGYDGADGTTAGESGADGGVAISVESLNVNMTGALYAYGGNGGDGVKGADSMVIGYTGGTGANATANGGWGANASNGKPGGIGGTGGDGGDGGNGASAIYTDSVEIISGDIVIESGAGGNGGAGGKGGRGGTGGTGGSDDWWGPGANSPGAGGQGGQGGTGGAGGNAGLYAQPILSLTLNDKNYTIISEGGNLTLRNGNYGMPGEGGSGGDPGEGGSGGSGGNNGGNGAGGMKGAVGFIGRKGGGYYNGHYYLFIETVATWEDAKIACEEMGGHLVTIQDANENEFVRELIGQNYIWLGGNDFVTEGSFVWITGEEFVYTNWAPGEPNNVGGVQDYMVMYPSGQWDDDNVTTRYYICEFVC